MIHQGQVVRKLVQANQGLKVNKNAFQLYVLCSLRLFKLKTEGKTM